MCKRSFFHHIFRCKSERNSQFLCWPGGSLCKGKDCAWNKKSPSFCTNILQKIAHKPTSEDSEFLQFDFDKSLTEEIYDTFWCFGIVTEVNVHEGDLKIEFIHSHGPRKTFSWPSVTHKCFVPASNVLCVITAPTTITGRMYRISDTDFEQTLKAYENHKM